jgi:hypothetical protein
MGSHVPCKCEALQLGHYLLKSGDSAHISISKVMHFVQRAELLNAQGIAILLYSILFYSILFYSILFYSILFYSILELLQFQTKSHNAPQL